MNGTMIGFVRSEELPDIFVQVAENRAGDDRRNHRHHRQPRDHSQARADKISMVRNGPVSMLCTT